MCIWRDTATPSYLNLCRLAHTKASQISDAMYCCAGGASAGTRWEPPTCSPPTAGDLIRRYMTMTDFTYPINTASKQAQRLFDIVSESMPSLSLHLLFLLPVLRLTPFALAAPPVHCACRMQLYI